MRLEEFLVAEGVIRPIDLARAAERSETRGGRITDNLLALELVTAEQIDAALHMISAAAALGLLSRVDLKSRTTKNRYDGDSE